MFGGLGDIGGMLKKANELKGKMAAVEKELQNTVIKEVSRDGALEVEITGKMKLKSVRLLQDFAAADRAKIEKTIYEVFNAALERVGQTAQQKLAGATGGLKIPGLF
ncbi:nucleoid-associated protein YbaB/EbfC family [Candidatus Termititenax persephonae]|uniref:Nucleoid-associated protein YbaB/EbfC family n=1 Tax=Candidatus Termititenax persephonae TaxID=2218525 RepID=A0A388THR1_9BACT|nr:nucleoid-associated protein YbaB/EbfC family [Candidatus Termititenax persephonae]